jgi:hypothetical protein
MLPVQGATHIPGCYLPEARRLLPSKPDPATTVDAVLHGDDSLLLELADESEPVAEKPKQAGRARHTEATDTSMSSQKSAHTNRGVKGQHAI